MTEPEWRVPEFLQSACDRGKKLPSGIIECEIKNERLVLLQLRRRIYRWYA